MFRSISRVFFVLICASGATVAMAVNEKNDTDQPISGLLCMKKECGLAYVPAVNDHSSCLGNQYTTACYGGASTYGNVKAYSCVSCPSGYTLTGKTETADASSTSLCKFRYYECEKEICNKTCLGFQQWKLASERENYESSYVRRLNTITCTCDTIYSYRCTTGYYNALSNTNAVVSDKKNLRCVKCPPVPDKGALSYGTAKAGYNAGKNSCYTDKGDSYSHKVQEGIKTKTIGKYRLSADCYYK